MRVCCVPCMTLCNLEVTCKLAAAVLVAADQDSVRLLAVQCCGPLARTLSKAECLATVVPVVQRFAQVGTAQLYLRLRVAGRAANRGVCAVGAGQVMAGAI